MHLRFEFLLVEQVVDHRGPRVEQVDLGQEVADLVFEFGGLEGAGQRSHRIIGHLKQILLPCSITKLILITISLRTFFLIQNINCTLHNASPQLCNWLLIHLQHATKQPQQLILALTAGDNGRNNCEDILVALDHISLVCSFEHVVLENFLKQIHKQVFLLRSHGLLNKFGCLLFLSLANHHLLG